jgi:phage gp45-like
MDIKPNEAITTLFGSYNIKTDKSKKIISVQLEGLGAEVIQDIAEE